MKKIFIIIAMAMITIAMHAQSSDLQFCYEDGTIIPDGSTVTIDVKEELDEQGFPFVLGESGIYIKNTTSSSIDATLAFNVWEITENSTLMTCIGTQCHPYYCVGNYSLCDVLGGGSVSSMQCHWEPAMDWDTEEYVYGICTAEYSIRSGSVTCSTITVKFIYADPAGISTVEKNATVVNQYDVQGRMVANHKGLIIKKMSDGTVRKELVK